jgi:hypothetical protein
VEEPVFFQLNEFVIQRWETANPNLSVYFRVKAKGPAEAGPFALVQLG